MKKVLKILSLALALQCVASVKVFQKEASAVSVYSQQEFVAELNSNDNSKMEIANGWTNGNPFNCTWRQNNVSFNNGIMSLTIDRDSQGGSIPYSGAEYRTRDFFHYGMFETSMKAIKNDGVVSSFFTYTGPSDNNPWDEIDIEILGKDTTKVQFNYYTNGVGNHEYMYDLGFDASKEFHKYGFLWSKDSITWYVDSKPVYKATTNIPSTPGKIMMNVWPGIGVDGWLSPYNGKTPLTAQYDYFSYTKEGGKPITGNVLLGDVDGNSVVNIKDYVKLQKYILNSQVTINEKNSDMNKDNQINVTDLLILKNKLLNE